MSFGEIFDRALTLYVRNLLPFLALAVAVGVPVALTELYSGLPFARSALLLKISNPYIFAGMYRKPDWVLIVSGLILWFLCLTVVAGVAAIATATLYRGAVLRLRDCFARLSSVGWAGVWLAIAAICLMVDSQGDAMVNLRLFPSTFLYQMSRMVFAAGANLAIAVLTAGVLATVYFAFCAVSIDGMDSQSAWERAFDMMFAEGHFLRAFGVTIGILTFVFAAIFGADFLLGTTHSWYSVVLQAIVTPFAFIALTVLYFDLRSRSEGLDLQHEMESLHD